MKDMKKAEELLKKVNEALEALTYDRKPETLYAPIKYVLSLGGKRVRPVLMLLAYNLYKDDPERIMTQAIGLETYHNFTLLHDDLMDNADMRRGHETVHRKWDPNQAILSGDTMLLQAFQRMGQCEADKLQDVIGCFTETTLEIDEGQQLDVEFETRDDVKEEEYIEMIRLKTSVLLACAVKIGAILAGASKVNRWVWPSSCRTTCSTCMAIRRCSARISAVTSPRTRRPICSSTPSTVPTRRSVRN